MSRAKMLQDLKRSGLTDRDARKLGYKLLTPAQTKKQTGKAENNVPSYLIPYYDVNGKLIKEMWRVRFLEEVKGKFGATLKKPRRYSQPNGVVPRFYFPKTVPVPWKKLANNENIPLVMTEGEKKAAKACKEGLPTIGLGGVWSWKSKKHNLPVIPDFDVIKWEGRDVILCFDNDVMTNPLVIGALSALSHELTQHGATVYIKFLPKGPGKIGLDDWLVKLRKNADVHKKFEALYTEPFSESAELWRFNEDHCYIHGLKAFYCFSRRLLFKTEGELLTAYKSRSFTVPKADGEGYKTVKTVTEWAQWPRRQEYENLVFVPGGPDVIDNCINTWPGWAIEPVKGSVQPWKDLINFLFQNEPDTRKWFLQWLAYPIQNPGAKMLNAVLFHSRGQGVGKSFVGYIVADMYGNENSSVIEQDQLHSSFNSWAASKQFILGEEITGSDSRRDADRIKNMITREKVTVNVKMQPEYVLQDRANYILTSNHVDALFIDEYDRRVFVLECPDVAESNEFYERIDVWRKNGGASHLFYHLLNDIDCSDFNPQYRPPETQAKKDMVALSKSDLDLAVEQLKANPDSVLTFQKVAVPNDIFTIEQLRRFMFPDNPDKHTNIATSKALRRGGFKMRPVRTEDGIHKLWAVRNRDDWNNTQPKEWAKHFDQHRRKVKYK